MKASNTYHLSPLASTQPWRRRILRAGEGNALVEFALLLPVLFMLIAVTCHFGFIIILSQELFTAATSSARLIIAANSNYPESGSLQFADDSDTAVLLRSGQTDTLLSNIETVLANQVRESGAGSFIGSAPPAFGFARCVVRTPVCAREGIRAAVTVTYQSSLFSFLGLNNFPITQDACELWGQECP